MALSDYGFVNNDIIINTPIEKIITGFLLAINKVYYAIAGSDNGNISTFLASVSLRHFIIDIRDYDYLRVAEQVMFYEGYSNINNVYKRYCYLNETSGVFILYNGNNDNIKLANRNIVLQDAVAQLIDEGFQTSILPFYYYNNNYLNAVEFESFYRIFTYPFFKDYFIQRLKYLSLLRIYTEYRSFYLDDEFIIETFSGSKLCDNVLDGYNELQFVYAKWGGGNFYLLRVEVYKNTSSLSFNITRVIKNIYIPKRIIDSYILNYDDNNFFNQAGAFQSTNGLLSDDGVMFNGIWTRLDLSTTYSITYQTDNGAVTEDCYKIDYHFDITTFVEQQIGRLNNLVFADASSEYCTWTPYGLNDRLTTISDGFDFSDI